AEDYIQQIEGKLDKAKIAIDKDCNNPQKANNAQVWYLKGYIYAEIGKSAVYNNLCDNCGLTALEAIQKCQRLDTENKFYSECFNVLFEIGTMFYDQAIKSYNSGVNSGSVADFSAALASFEFFFETQKTMGNDDKMIKHLLEYNKINPNSIKVYAGYSAQKTGNNEKAKAFYGELIDYKSDINTAKSKGLPLAYIYLSDILIAEGNLDEATMVVKRGVTLYPDNTDLIISCIDMYFKSDKVDELAEIVEIALKNNPKDIDLLVILAGAYNKISKLYTTRGYSETSEKYRAKAIEAYDKALAMKPVENDILYKINYNCGLLYYNPGVQLYIKKDESLKEQWTALFSKALPYLTKAHELDPSNRILINILMKIYQCLGQIDKAMEMEEKLY
ncbi:MAG: hypothetical protein ABIJ16_04120, partial [Bacteroidota bacterium]